VVTAMARLGKQPIPKEATKLSGIPQRQPNRRASNKDGAIPNHARENLGERCFDFDR